MWLITFFRCLLEVGITIFNAQMDQQCDSSQSHLDLAEHVDDCIKKGPLGMRFLFKKVPFRPLSDSFALIFSRFSGWFFYSEFC